MNINEKLFHRGYTSDIYLIDTPSGKLLKKYFLDKNCRLSAGMAVADIFNEEIEGIKLLNSIHNEKIITPEIIEVSYEGLYYSQRYYKLETFHRYVIVQSWYHPMKLQRLFYSLGEYLAIFHETNKRLHGDLNRKNILFHNDMVFICDPCFYPKFTNEKHTFDLFKVIYSFYPYNLFYRILIKGKKALIAAFLKGYFNNSTQIFNKEEFRADAIQYLDETSRILMSKGLVSYLKYLYIRFISKRMASSLRNNQLDWDYEKN